jgi:hypothetical protein
MGPALATFAVATLLFIAATDCGHAKPPPMPAPEYEEPSQPIPSEAPSATPSASPSSVPAS